VLGKGEVLALAVCGVKSASLAVTAGLCKKGDTLTVLYFVTV
jgi:hypothetical protein